MRSLYEAITSTGEKVKGYIASDFGDEGLAFKTVEQFEKEGSIVLDNEHCVWVNSRDDLTVVTPTTGIVDGVDLEYDEGHLVFDEE